MRTRRRNGISVEVPGAQEARNNRRGCGGNSRGRHGRHSKSRFGIAIGKLKGTFEGPKAMVRIALVFIQSKITVSTK
jgi:hypothetical protein